MAAGSASGSKHWSAKLALHGSGGQGYPLACGPAPAQPGPATPHTASKSWQHSTELEHRYVCDIVKPCTEHVLPALLPGLAALTYVSVPVRLLYQRACLSVAPTSAASCVADSFASISADLPQHQALPQSQPQPPSGNASMPPPKPRPRLSVRVGDQLVPPAQPGGQTPNQHPTSRHTAAVQHRPLSVNSSASSLASSHMHQSPQPAGVRANPSFQQASDTSDLAAMERQTQLHSVTAASNLSAGLSANALEEASHKLLDFSQAASTQVPSQPVQQAATAQQQRPQLQQPQLQQQPLLQQSVEGSGLHWTALRINAGSAAAGGLSGYYRPQRGAVRGLLLALELPHKEQVAVYRPATGAAAKALPVSQLATRYETACQVCL